MVERRKESNTMAAPKGNDFYKRRAKDGREAKFKPEELLEAAYNYFDWCKETPMYKREVLKGGAKAGTVIKVEIDRPYTIVGLCNHVGISEKTFRNYDEQQDYLPITTHIREVIVQNQLEGALVEAYSPNIVARVLSLTDKQEHNVKTDLTINVASPDTEDKLRKLQEDLQKE